ncbi:MAG: Na(+)-translocating NADH-quinone reductase subunit A [Bacteroidales bacterium]|jgi:Na+-transporting NADH:ubiquinone oxidoreductase subunit A|nr:Na(+)-translocating NADH-quinone reductase subunit A [Bacteroidales bacterium]
MSTLIKLRKGLNIKLAGKAEKILLPEAPVTRYGVRFADFPGLVARLEVQEGDKVMAGSVLFHDKMFPEIKYVSPVSGVVREVLRGEKRVLTEVIIDLDGTGRIDFGAADPLRLSRGEVTEKLLKSGLWPVLRQRPYHIVARPSETPRDIFISAFDTAPLAPDLDFIMANTHGGFLQTGINVLSRLTDGKVHISQESEGTRVAEMKNLQNVEFHRFSGPHPAGNVGVQIHHIAPVSKGEVVWTLDLQDVVAIGRLFSTGFHDREKIIALAGPGAQHRKYHRIRPGASVESILKGNLGEGNMRIISGNVLTGKKISQEGSFGFYDNMVTVIPEGDYHEFFGWATPGLTKFSYWRTFLSKLLPGREFQVDTNMHGGHRAFVVSGHYENVLPMDIYPVHLLKAILAGDIELMENLGIYEVAEEDFALCEYIDPSKTEIQEIIRSGISLMIKEMN